MADIPELTAVFLISCPYTIYKWNTAVGHCSLAQASSAGYRTSTAGAGNCLANVCCNSPNTSVLVCTMSIFLLIGADTGMKTSSIKQQLRVTTVPLCTSTQMLIYACPSKMNNLSLLPEKH